MLLILNCLVEVRNASSSLKLKLKLKLIKALDENSSLS